MPIPMTATKSLRYRTRRLLAGDEFEVRNEGEARLFSRMGAVRVAAPKPAKTGDSDLTKLRAEYQAKFGKRPFNGWSVEKLRERIAAA